MFNKKCSRCGEKINKKFDFCPFCGWDLKKEKEIKDYGLIGKEDAIPKFGVKMPFGFNRLFNSLLREFNKQFKELDKETGKIRKEQNSVKKFPGGISISIFTETGGHPKIRVKGLGDNKKILSKKKISCKNQVKTVKLSKDKMKKLATFPREEPEASVRRLSDKIIYELDLPGVRSVSDILINKLENSIEVRALGKDKAYFKLLPISLPLLSYILKQGKLVLEFQPGN